MGRLALGIAPHTGWAIAVVVGGGPGAPEVLHRERVALIPEDVERMAYHAAQDLPVEAARTQLAATDAAVAEATDATVAALVARAREHGDVVGMGVVGRPQELPDDLGRILANHMLLHAAEGDLYLSALLDAAEARRLPTVLAPPKQTVEGVAAALGTSADLLGQRLTDLRAALGAPWQADHKAATAAALLALAR